MKHGNIAFFIPHLGCPHNCTFCNQNSISAAESLPTAETVLDVCRQAWSRLGQRVSATEIAFFGGSFTAIERTYMLELLEAAQRSVEQYGFSGIRCSTRPDAVDEEIVALLKEYGVTSIELGCQSMNNRVLSLNQRGHTAEDTVTASKIIKKNGILLGHQMMVGMYGDTAEGIFETARCLKELEPDTMRIYPTVVIKGTELESLWSSGEYVPMSLDDAVDVCSRLLLFFEHDETSPVRVIRVGLHASRTLEDDMLAGTYHPAFRELCESKIMLDRAMKKLKKCSKETTVNIFVNPRDVSRMIGQKHQNVAMLKKMGYTVEIISDKNITYMNPTTK